MWCSGAVSQLMKTSCQHSHQQLCIWYVGASRRVVVHSKRGCLVEGCCRHKGHHGISVIVIVISIIRLLSTATVWWFHLFLFLFFLFLFDLLLRMAMEDTCCLVQDLPFLCGILPNMTRGWMGEKKELSQWYEFQSSSGHLTHRLCHHRYREERDDEMRLSKSRMTNNEKTNLP